MFRIRDMRAQFALNCSQAESPAENGSSSSPDQKLTSDRIPISDDPHREFAVDVVRRLRTAGHVAYWAGGCVRDRLLGKTPKDYDVATDARPDQVRSLFGPRKTIPVGESFGVIIVTGPKTASPIEVATFRSEGEYRDGRRPESVTFSTPQEDAQRRDFTINGMFFDPIDDRVLDFVGGQSDLEQGVIRAIGNPLHRMTEDKLRLLRTVRFATTLKFAIDPDTAAAVRTMASQLGVVSVERIAQELRKILIDSERVIGIRLCRELGLMDSILPELGSTEDAATLAVLERLEGPSFSLALAVLLRSLSDRENSSSPIDACRRLKLSNDETDAVRWLHANAETLAGIDLLSDAALKRLMAHPQFDQLLRCLDAQAGIDATHRAALDTFRQRTAPWTASDIDPPQLLNGNDLIRLGMRPGPMMKSMLIAIRDAQLNGALRTADEAERFVTSQFRNDDATA
jgi:poly(A) polymerase